MRDMFFGCPCERHHLHLTHVYATAMAASGFAHDSVHGFEERDDHQMFGTRRPGRPGLSDRCGSYKTYMTSDAKVTGMSAPRSTRIFCRDCFMFFTRRRKVTQYASA